MKNSYQVCTRCVMDTSAPTIRFNEQGVCNFCTDFLDRSSHIIALDEYSSKEALHHLVQKVKDAGRGKRYDCIVGVSGGVDSSWVLVQAVKLGLRPLAVHMDNGWNSELAQNNVANLIQTLGVDLYTHVIDWKEYRNLMQSFFDADVIDVELLYDNAVLAVIFQQAARFGVRTILSGANQATEGMQMPEGWNWFKFDKRNILALSKAHTGQKLKSFPAIGTLQWLWYEKVKGIRLVPVLDLMPYNKFDIMAALERDYGYKPYPYKHYESIFTRFYQGYILPMKFGVDKRKLHHSTLVVSGQMTRQAALDDLKSVAYGSARSVEQDKRYFIKKMRWTAEQFETYIKRPPVAHDAYKSEKGLWEFLSRLKKKLRSRRA